MPTTALPDTAPLAYGTYTGTPVVVVAESDGWLTCLWPDNEKPRKGRPFTYGKGEWWRIPKGQVEIVAEFPT